jgi:hypothetical protein
LNLPIVPITDLTIKNDNLIAATQGRSFWLIDDITPLHQLSTQIASNNFHLFRPIASYRMDGGGGFRGGASKTEGTNHPGGVTFHYYLKSKPADSVEVKLSIMEMSGKLIKEYSTKAKEENLKIAELKAGGNTFNWNMRYPDATRFEGMILWAGGTVGPKAVPGKYKAKLQVGKESQEIEFEILKDPRSESSIADLQEQFDFLTGIRDKVSEAHQTILDIRTIKRQLNHFKELWKDDPAMKPLIDKANDIEKEISKIENELYQTKNRSGQDPLNFPIKLSNKLAYVGSVSGGGDFKPTKQAKEVKEEMTQKINSELSKFEQVKSTLLPEFNKQVREKGMDAIMMKEAKPKS